MVWTRNDSYCCLFLAIGASLIGGIALIIMGINALNNPYGGDSDYATGLMAQGIGSLIFGFVLLFLTILIIGYNRRKDQERRVYRF